MLSRLIGEGRAEHGASAIFIAFAMVLAMGVAAVVIDATGVGYNERRQDQTAADTAVMSGSLGVILGESTTTQSARALEVARANLDNNYTDPEWQALWEGCTDPDGLVVDVGGNSVLFTPMPSPFASPTPGFEDLECVSRSTSYMRVVIPNQSVDTSFGSAIGFDSITTNASAIARIEYIHDEDGLLPYGIPGDSGDGEACLSSNPSGLIEPPCQGPSSGGFGAINSEFFGDFFGTASCANPGSTELAQNTALGLDHYVELWTNPVGVSPGDPHPGDGTVIGYQDVSYDQCTLSGGVVSPQQVGQSFPPNTFRVDTGFSQSAAVESGLISNNTFLGRKSRLQNTSNPTQDLVKKRLGATNTVYELDDRGPWAYLNEVGPVACHKSSYTGLTTDDKVILFQQCLSGYSGSTDIFDASIADSPRFGWAPQYWFAAATTGTSWQPVMQYRMVFLGGLWFNCNAVPGSCGAVFYPDEDTTGEICDPSGGGCKELSLDQMAAWVIPGEAVPESVSTAFPGGEETPFITTLFR